jgi:hypothetical protein
MIELATIYWAVDSGAATDALTTESSGQFGLVVDEPKRRPCGWDSSFLVGQHV